MAATILWSQTKELLDISISQTYIVSSCGLYYHGAGYTLIYFSKSDIFVAVRVIRRAGYRPENTVIIKSFSKKKNQDRPGPKVLR